MPSFLTYVVLGTIAWPYVGCMYVLDDVETCSLGMIPNESGSFANSAFCKIDEKLNPLGPGRCDEHGDCQGSRTCGKDGYCTGEHMCQTEKEGANEAATQWCKSFDQSPWDLFNEALKGKENCALVKIADENDTDKKNGCNYFERAGSYCFYAEEKEERDSWCECVYDTPGRSKWG